MKSMAEKSKINSSDKSTRAIFYAVLAAALFGICSPISKLLLVNLDPTFMAALLYLGAGAGMLAVRMTGLLRGRPQSEAKITKNEFPYVASMILLDIGAPIFLMLGLTLTAASTASLLNNFEIVATSAVAMIFFREPLGRRMWLAILLITVSSIILSVENIHELSFSPGALFVLAACLCWGVENNCTRRLSLKDPLQIVIIKGFGSGIGAFLISAAVGGVSGKLSYIMEALLLGFVSYGLSIFFYIAAQRVLGAARTSIYYAAAPFIGVIISWIVLRDAISGSFLTALSIMLIGTYFAISEKHKHRHAHTTETHEHRHSHNDGHHTHSHGEGFSDEHSRKDSSGGEHSHVHTHQAVEHTHPHTPELHHQHRH
jgi:drug/metabolite transporter (DMT)-like permease